MERERQLGRHLEGVAYLYDYVVLDCPPSLGLLAVNALRAATQVLVPLEASLYALDGLQRLREIARLIETRYDLELPIRLLPTMFDNRTRLARQLFALLQDHGGSVCDTHIRACIKVREAAMAGLPLLVHAPHAATTSDFHALAGELRALCEPCIPAQAARQPTAREVVLNFQDLECRRLQIAGDFNDWIPDDGVETRQIAGRWQKVLRVPEGAYEYRVIIDGIWQQDPTNPTEVPNSLGGNNSLLRV